MITAVIPVYNRADLLEHLLETLARQTVPFEEVVVVDNHSTDGAGDVARRYGCRVITLRSNTGFAHAVNIGCRAAATAWVAILNSDVELDPAWLESLLAHAENASFATGTILDATQRTRVDGTYDLVTRGGCAWRAGHGFPFAEPAGGNGAVRRIAIAPGTACLFRRDVLEKVGGFEESFGSYLEDVDLGLRCVERGLTGVYVPAAIAWHHGSATLGRWNAQVVRLISRNQVLLVARHYDKALLWSCLWPIVAGQFLWGLVAARHGAALPWLAGKWDGLRTFRLDGKPNALLVDFLRSSERQIREQATGSYWRWYFRLTGGKTPAEPDAAA